jgi:hypothetical protein
LDLQQLELDLLLLDSAAAATSSPTNTAGRPSGGRA